MLRKDIKKYEKNKLTLDELQEFYCISSYTELVTLVTELIRDMQIEPIISSKGNGKKPALYQAYRILREKKADKEWEEELHFLVPELNPTYYLKHLEVYEQDREYVLRLNRYLIASRDKVRQPASINERSFEIFFREKFLKKEGGERILKNLMFSSEELHYYETSEPLAYYSHKKNPGQVMLIIENKDTFYSMRKHLMEGHETILGMKIGTLIYGGGKAIYKSFSDFDRCVEPYMKAKENEILYFGDLDFEGILIYEQLQEIVKEEYKIAPFIEAYEKMLEKAVGISLPKTKEKQNRNCGMVFFSYFSGYTVEKIRDILDAEDYIPQEILQSSDL